MYNPAPFPFITPKTWKEWANRSEVEKKRMRKDVAEEGRIESIEVQKEWGI